MYTTHWTDNKRKSANLIRSGSKGKFLKTCRTLVGSELWQYSGRCSSRRPVLQHRRCNSRPYITLINLRNLKRPILSNLTGRQRPLKTSSPSNNKAQCHKGLHKLQSLYWIGTNSQPATSAAHRSVMSHDYIRVLPLLIIATLPVVEVQVPLPEVYRCSTLQ